MSGVIPNFHSKFQNQFGVKIKSFKANKTREYFNQILYPFQKNGIIHKSPFNNTPNQNGAAEKKKRHFDNPYEH